MVRKVRWVGILVFLYGGMDAGRSDLFCVQCLISINLCLFQKVYWVPVVNFL